MLPLGRNATRFAVDSRAFGNAFTLFWLLALGSAQCVAADLHVSVLDRQGRGVEQVVVTATPLNSPVTNPLDASAIMDQRDLAFLPRILVIATGTRVDFPNSDSVSHQVYSFSAAKRFQLPLYKGETHTPIRFESEGLVVLGCNIHDQMVGYIYVTAAPFFGKTNAGGTLDLSGLVAGDYRITAWNPYIGDAPKSLTHTLHVSATDGMMDEFRLTRELRTRPEPRPRRADWEY